MVQHNLNWSLQYPVTDLMGGVGTEQLAVQMDEKHAEQRTFIMAHFQSVQIFCCRPICFARMIQKLWLKLRESPYLPCCFVACPSATSRVLRVCLCVCTRAPGCVTHLTESVTLLRHLMCPVAHPIPMTMLACLWERRLFQRGRVDGRRGFM